MAQPRETEGKKKGESAAGGSEIDVLSGELHAQRMAARLPVLQGPLSSTPNLQQRIPLSVRNSTRKVGVGLFDEQLVTNRSLRMHKFTKTHGTNLNKGSSGGRNPPNLWVVSHLHPMYVIKCMWKLPRIAK